MDDFNFELKKARPKKALHSLNQEWSVFQNTENVLLKKDKKPPPPLTNDVYYTVFPNQDLSLYGTSPILEVFTPLSYLAPSVHTSSNERTSKSRKRHTNHEHTYSELKDDKVSNGSNLFHKKRISSSSSSRRHVISSSPQKSSGSSARTSGNSTSSNNASGGGSTRSSYSRNGNSNSNHCPSNVKRKSHSEVSLPQLLADNTCDKVAERPLEPTGVACRARTELIALKVSTPDIIPDPMPTVADSPENAGSPSKPTDESAFPDDQSFSSPSAILDQSALITISPEPTPPSSVQPLLLTITSDELNIDKLKSKHPGLFKTESSTQEPNLKQFTKYDPFKHHPELSEDPYFDCSEPRRKLIKFRFTPYTQIEYATKSFDTIKPSTPQVYLMELEEPTSPPPPLPSGTYEIQMTKAYYRINPDPGIYENQIEMGKKSPKKFVSSSFSYDENGLSWTPRNSKTKKDDDQMSKIHKLATIAADLDLDRSNGILKCNPNTPDSSYTLSNSYLQEGFGYDIMEEFGFGNADIEKEINYNTFNYSAFNQLNMDYEMYQAPPTPQTPVCMKRVRTDEELALSKLFSGLYYIDNVQEQCNQVLLESEISTNGASQEFVTNRLKMIRGSGMRARAISGKIGNVNMSNMWQDVITTKTIKNFFNNINKNVKIRNRTH